MEKLCTQFKAFLTGNALQNLYAMLDNEERPYSVNVSKAKNKQHTITLRIRTEDALYFAEIIDRAKQC